MTGADETGAVTREVAENTAPGGNVGAPVTAMGPGTLVYSLEGSDAKYFNIESGTARVVRVRLRWAATSRALWTTLSPGTDPELDFEDPMKQRFSVTVKVEVMAATQTKRPKST